MIKVLLSQAQRKIVSQLFSKFDDRLNLNEKNQRVICFSAEEANAINQALLEARSNPENGLKQNPLLNASDAFSKAIENAEGIGTIPISVRLYQFKITLIESEPSIWRRIQVRNCSLDKLHEHIQTSMGWTNSHLHQFEIDDEKYGDPELLDDGFEGFECVDSTVTMINDIVPKSGERFKFQYRYDFGDDWQHEILFEGCLTAKKGDRYPICIEGERACPPEDVGGIGGYYEFLQIIANPKHKQHDQMREWSGPFHPEQFDAEKATKKMRRGLPDWRQYE